MKLSTKHVTSVLSFLPLLGILYYSPGWFSYSTSLFTRLTRFPEFIRDRSVQILERETFPPGTLPPEVIEIIARLKEQKAQSYRQSPGFEKRGSRYQQRLTEGAWPIRYNQDLQSGFVVLLPTERAEFSQCKLLFEGKENLLVYCP